MAEYVSQPGYINGQCTRPLSNNENETLQCSLRGWGGDPQRVGRHVVDRREGCTGIRVGLLSQIVALFPVSTDEKHGETLNPNRVASNPNRLSSRQAGWRHVKSGGVTSDRVAPLELCSFLLLCLQFGNFRDPVLGHPTQWGPLSGVSAQLRT